MDSKTRKELKSDHFVEEVGHGVDYVAAHRSKFIKIGIGVVAVLALAGGIYAYLQNQQASRMELLGRAYMVQDAPVGEPQEGFVPKFKTPSERQAAATKAFQEVVTKYGSSNEGKIAKYFLGVYAANDAKWPEAEAHLKEAVSADPETASLANLTLAQIYAAQNRTADAEKLLRTLMDKPTLTVSKEQAQITLGKILLASKPEEAKKLLEPLRTERSAVSRAAVAALAGAQ
jgi:predicted negative regulator of RcsB-dependent stress response